MINNTFLVYILKNNFHQTSEEANATFSNIVFFTNLVLIFGKLKLCKGSDFIIGALLEMIGRKYVTGFGLILSSISIFFVGIPINVFELYILRFLVATGVLPILMSPLVADYVEKDHRG